jgi:hypothetical protein
VNERQAGILVTDQNLPALLDTSYQRHELRLEGIQVGDVLLRNFNQAPQVIKFVCRGNVIDARPLQKFGTSSESEGRITSQAEWDVVLCKLDRHWYVGIEVGRGRAKFEDDVEEQDKKCAVRTIRTFMSVVTARVIRDVAVSCTTTEETGYVFEVRKEYNNTGEEANEREVRYLRGWS